MSSPVSRRVFGCLAAGSVAAAHAEGPAGTRPDSKAAQPGGSIGPVEADFRRDYPAPGFRPSWKKPQINRLMVQDFVIYAHSELDMVKKLLAREPALLNATMDWGGGDWESGLGGASHMGRRDIAEYLLEKGARIDLFCAAMLGQLDAVKSFLKLQPALIDARGPHGFSLHFHAQVGGEAAEPVLDYLQSVKKVLLGPNPFLKPPPAGK
ncbi:MAG: hypothetical protein U0790_22190 [Isosphaeraceae bacterium]